MKLVIALGGNALLRRGEPPDAETQKRNVAAAADSIAALAREHTVIVTHGNGPQVGLLALQSAACHDVAPYPLDALGAESEGLIGYMIEQALASRLRGRSVATLLTQVEVDPNDPAFARPEKPIGPVYDAATAEHIAAARNWRMARDGEMWRRVVPSPEPRRILELSAIRLLVDASVVVICAGGGGIPVVVDDAGGITGVEAVIDKDLAAALLAIELKADRLLLLTDVPAVFADWPSPKKRAIRRATPDAISPDRFAAGSMRPKMEAACRFASRTGGAAVIGALDSAAALLAGVAGTTIAAGTGRLILY